MLDALTAHLLASDSIDWAAPSPALCARLAALRPGNAAARAPVDGQSAYVAARDALRDPERARHFLEAMRRTRDLASAPEPLTWAVLTDIQREVLGGGDVAFRRSDAYAKGGAERYGWSSDLEELFAARLVEATTVAPHPVARAARTYLDICFFHPFVDGNARAARLALDFTLNQAGITLGDARLVFAPPIPAGRRGAYLDFLWRVLRACEAGAARSRNRGVHRPSGLPSHDRVGQAEHHLSDLDGGACRARRG